MKKYAEDRERCLKQQNEVVGNNCIFSVLHLLSLEFIPEILLIVCIFAFVICFEEDFLFVP